MVAGIPFMWNNHGLDGYRSHAEAPTSEVAGLILGGGTFFLVFAGESGQDLRYDILCENASIT
jgi:hypothetical protein